jgi:hypothetical protein
MFCFHKKKKDYTKVFVILGIVIGVAAAAVGGYFLFTKVLKDKLCKKKCCEAADECCDCEEIVDETCEAVVEAVEDVVEDVVEEIAEAVEE